jgi:hypothetical protein
MRELDMDYDISVSNMNDIINDCGNFAVEDVEFYDMNSKKLTTKKVLVNEGKQIFSMTDGIYILDSSNYLLVF